MWLAAVSTLLSLILSRILWRRWKYDLHKIPSPPKLPLLGHTLDLLLGSGARQFAVLLRNYSRQLDNPPVFLVSVLGESWLFLSDLDVTKKVILSKTAPLPKAVEEGLLALVGDDRTAKSLSTETGVTPHVRAVRKIISTAFQNSHMKLEVPKINKVLDSMVAVIESKRLEGAINFQDLCVKMTLDVIGVVAFDTNLGGLDGSKQLQSQLIKVGHIARGRFTNPLDKMLLKFLPGCHYIREQNAEIDKLTAEWDALVDLIKGREDPTDRETEPIWLGLKRLREPDTGEPPSDRSLRANIGTIVLAGMDTTGHQLGWILALLASHPHVYARLVEELKEWHLAGPEAREAVFEDLGELDYLTAVIKEGMRIAYIASALFFRPAADDMMLLGYRVPKGTKLFVAGTRVVSRESEWGDPEVFRPERWLTDEDMSHKYYLGFSYGPRDCIGQKLSMLEMRLAIIKIVSKYQLTLKGDIWQMLEESVDGLVTEARDGVWLQVTPTTHTPTSKATHSAASIA